MQIAQKIQVNDTHAIAAVFHQPTGIPDKGKVPAVLFLHGRTGDKNEANGIFQRAAEALAEAGIAVLRIDYRGCGESTCMPYEDLTFDTLLADANAALTHLANQNIVDANRIGVLGMSWGGLVASYLSKNNKGVKSVVLWNPVDSLGPSVQSWSKQQDNLAKGFFEFGKNQKRKLKKEFLEVAPKYFEGPDAISHLGDKALIIHGKEKADVESAQKYEGKNKVIGKLVVGGNHVFEGDKASGEVIAKTVNWIQQKL